MAKGLVIVGLVALAVLLISKTDVPPECAGKTVCVFLTK